MVYGVIFWFIFSLAKMSLGRKREPVEELEEALEEALEKATRTEEEASKILVELMGTKGIGPERAKQLKAAGVNNVSDLAKSSAMELSEKTGIPEKK